MLQSETTDCGKKNKFSIDQSKKNSQNNLIISGNPCTLRIWACVRYIEPKMKELHQDLQGFTQVISKTLAGKRKKNYKEECLIVNMGGQKYQTGKFSLILLKFNWFRVLTKNQPVRSGSRI